MLPTPPPDANDSTASTSTTPSCPAGFGAAAATGPVTSFGDGSTCPLGFGGGKNNRKLSATSFSNGGLPRMPLAVLAAHHSSSSSGASADVRLVAIKGVVFDVSEDDAYRAGGALARLPGHDASRLIAVSGSEGVVVVGSGGAAVNNSSIACGDLLDAGLEGLRYEDHQRLETYFVEIARARRAVAVLADEDHVR